LLHLALASGALADASPEALHEAICVFGAATFAAKPKLRSLVELLGLALYYTEAKPSQLPSTPADPRSAAPCILFLGPRQYVPPAGGLPFCVSEREDNVLQAFLGRQAMDLPTLRDDSGEEEAARILAALQNKYDGVFSPAIRVPDGKGQGGYAANVKANGDH
jgi:hypothetical protein